MADDSEIEVGEREGDPGETGPNLTSAGRAAKGSEIAELDLRHGPQSAIAKKVGLSQSQVSRVLKLIAADYRQKAEDRFAEGEERKRLERERKLAEIDRLIFELDGAWERSKLERQTAETEKCDPGVGSDGKPTGRAGIAQP